MKNKIVRVMAVSILLATFLTGCQKGTENTAGASGEITIVSREEGSGTRGAFTELFEILEEGKEGRMIDNITDEAKVTNSTSVMMTTIQGDVNAIGYISLGSLNDTVKAIKIDGADASAENIDNGSYRVVRPFSIATKEGLSQPAQDFIEFIMSKEGQAIVGESGYIPVGDQPVYSGNTAKGKVVIGGSSSVTPVIEKIKEAYLLVNPNAEIEVHQNDSTTGMQSTIEGLCDIGMASRGLKDSEAKAGLTETVIAKDGIGIIVNNNSGIDELSSEQVKSIYTAETIEWEGLN